MQNSSISPFQQKKRIAALWFIAIAAITTMVLARPGILEDNYTHKFTEGLGVGLIFIAVLGRLWSILYIGTRKNSELITSGPYSMTRNPLYFFSMTGFAGIGLIYGSLYAALILMTIASALFLYTAKREARFLGNKFAGYADYARKTPLIIPDPRLYWSEREVTFSTATLARTFRDCIVFLAIYPLVEIIEMLKTSGWLAPQFYLP